MDKIVVRPGATEMFRPEFLERLKLEHCFSAKTLRNMIGLEFVPDPPMTLAQCTAKGREFGVSPEHSRATYRLFGENGPKPDDPLTPQQVQDVRRIFAFPTTASVLADGMQFLIDVGRIDFKSAKPSGDKVKLS